MSNVLSRLEAVMGIQIVSALANIHNRLIITSEVQAEFHEHGYKIEFPNPRRDPGQYVAKVFSLWSAGKTWRHLLEVLRDSGLPELSQRIDAFMKGKDWSDNKH